MFSIVTIENIICCLISRFYSFFSLQITPQAAYKNINTNDFPKGYDRYRWRSVLVGKYENQSLGKLVVCAGTGTNNTPLTYTDRLISDSSLRVRQNTNTLETKQKKKRHEKWTIINLVLLKFFFVYPHVYWYSYCVYLSWFLDDKIVNFTIL